MQANNSIKLCKVQIIKYLYHIEILQNWNEEILNNQSVSCLQKKKSE